MSLVKFHARNHRQQTMLGGPNHAVDDRATTPEVFDPLHERFSFSIDVSATPLNTKCPRFFTIEDDGLQQSWAGESVWCNPQGKTEVGPNERPPFGCCLLIWAAA